MLDRPDEARVAAKNAELYRRAAARLQQLYPAEDFPMPVEQFVRALHALTDGLVFIRFMQPELMTDDLIIAAFESLAPRHS